MIQSYRDKQSLLEEADVWLEDLRSNGRKSNTIMTHRNNVYQCLWRLAAGGFSTRAEYIGAGEIIYLWETMGLKEGVKRAYLRSLSNMVQFHTGRDPVKEANILYNRDIRERVFITKDEFIGAYRSGDEMERLVLILGGFLGLRRAEMVSITNADISGNMLTVHGKGHGEDGLVAVIPLNKPVMDAIAAYRASDMKQGVSLDDRLLQVRDHRGRLHGIPPTQLSNLVSDLGKRCGIRMTTHSLRRLYATLLYYDAECDLQTVKSMMRHADVSTTLKCYVDVNDLRIREANERLGEIFEECVADRAGDQIRRDPARWDAKSGISQPRRGDPGTNPFCTSRWLVSECNAYFRRKNSMSKTTMEKPARVRLAAVLMALAMAMAALVIIPAGASDADGDVIEVSSWDQLKDAVKTGDDVYIKLTGDISDKSDDDAIEIKGSEDSYPPLTVHIDLNGFEIDRNRGSEEGDDGRLFDITYALVYISNGTLTGGHGGDGGCIRLDSAYLELNDVVIDRCYSDADGGAIYAEDSVVVVKGVKTENDHSAKFAFNKCESDGGAIHLQDSSLRMENVLLLENYAWDDGGALCVSDSYFVATGCDFNGNYVDDDGGAIFVNGTVVDPEDPYERNVSTIDGNCTFIDNLAENGDGGAICVNIGKFYMSDVEFSENFAGGDGGALFLLDEDDNEVIISGKILITGNDAYGDGDNVFLDEDQVLYCGTLDASSSIGVAMDDGDGKFTKNFGEKNPDLDPATIFHSDDSDYYVAIDDGEAKLFKSNTGGDMSDNTVWIAIGSIVAIIVAAGALYYVLKVRKSKSA